MLLGGCATARPAPPPNTALTSAAAPARAVSARSEAAPKEAPLAQRPGDYVVYRFSGAFRKAPLTLTQRVLDVTGALMRLELTFDDAKTKRTVRALYDRAPGAVREVRGAARVGPDGAELPMTVAQLDAMMAETALAVDANEAPLGTEPVTIEVASRPIACTRAKFRVLVGKRRAIMTALESDAFPWGDVGGDITTDDGRVLYRAEVVDAGSASASTALR